MIYSQCKECGKLVPKSEDSCECGYRFSHAKGNETPLMRAFPSGYFRDIDYEPVYIKGRKQLLEETRRRGQVSLYAED